MRHARRPWLLVVPLGTLGVLLGHEIAYGVTRAPHEALHGYLNHLPTIALLLTILALVGASFVERDRRLALWPFPAVAISAFVAQEHIERIAHEGSIPFLLDQPVFLVGLGVQALVALAAWLAARLLVRMVGRVAASRPPGTVTFVDPAVPVVLGPRGLARARNHVPRGPPLSR